jgi:prophage maintenance system killer protein
VREAECPEATLGAAWSADEYSRPPEAQPGFLFSVYLLYYFTTKQCFNDGNKRVAWASMSEALARLDLEIDATDEEAEAFVLDIAERRINSIATVAAWVTARLRELSPRSEGLASPTRYRRVVDLD